MVELEWWPLLALTSAAPGNLCDQHDGVPFLATWVYQHYPPYQNSALDVGQTCPKRRLPQRQPRSLVAALSLHFLQPQRLDPSSSQVSAWLAHSMPEPCTRSVMITRGNGHWIPIQEARQTSLSTQKASPSPAIPSCRAGHILRGMESDWAQTSGLLL